MKPLAYVARLKSDSRLYASQALRAHRAGDVGTGHLVKAFPNWLKTFQSDRSSLEVGLPWLTYGAIDLLAHRVGPDSAVFEFGSGGSTLFFARRAKSVVSVEHDVEWGRGVHEALTRSGLRNWELHVVAPEAPSESPPVAAHPNDPHGYVSSDEAYPGLSFRRYAEVVDRYPDESFDIGIVDGRARPSCYEHLRAKVRIGGLVILDNSDRESYARVLADARGRGWSERVFSGPCPYSGYFTTTTVWTKTSP